MFQSSIAMCLATCTNVYVPPPPTEALIGQSPRARPELMDVLNETDHS